MRELLEYMDGKIAFAGVWKTSTDGVGGFWHDKGTQSLEEHLNVICILLSR